MLMQTIANPTTGTERFGRSTAQWLPQFPEVGASLFFGWLAVGVAITVAVHAGFAGMEATDQIRILAALAAGFGAVNLWLAFDVVKPVAKAALGLSGAAMIVLAVNALPGNPALIAMAYLIGALAMVFGTRRTAPLLIVSGSGLAVLALLSMS
ncbi:MAG: hypothetical protein QNJ40_12605 [Xanthomonadales bacterium]|nr:hypothetical protein [Xanthomonadales bacterium]